MAYRVEIARNAEAELEKLYLLVTARAPQQGARWFSAIEQAVLALDVHPTRCPIARDACTCLHYGRHPHVYRIFFTVDDRAKVVHVVHVRRGARRPATADDLKGGQVMRTRQARAAARERLRADVQAGFDQLVRGEGHPYDKTSGAGSPTGSNRGAALLSRADDLHAARERLRVTSAAIDALLSRCGFAAPDVAASVGRDGAGGS